MASRRAHVVLDRGLVAEIDRVVGKRRRSAFLADAASRELLRRHQIEALRRAEGAWKKRDHPELDKGAALFVRGLRQEGEKRLARVRRRP